VVIHGDPLASHQLLSLPLLVLLLWLRFPPLPLVALLLLRPLLLLLLPCCAPADSGPTQPWFYPLSPQLTPP
jgi:hypothetical protein